MADQIDEHSLDHAPSTKTMKKNRKRKKKLYKTIREQMEFYFSDSSLSKDKFMKDLIAQSSDGFIDLDVFATFNKIRSLTPDVSEIAQALWLSSDVLELNEDHTKVRRTTPVQPREDVDDCTIYVEHLPKHVDHAWLKRIFSSYGQVTYISLPKYKISGQSKGFAFVEFDTPTAAQRACEHLGTFSGDCSRAMKIAEPAERLYSTQLDSDSESAVNVMRSCNAFQQEPIEQESRLEPRYASPEAQVVQPPKKRKSDAEKHIPFKKRLHSDESDEDNKESVRIKKFKEKDETETSLLQDVPELPVVQHADLNSQEQKITKKNYIPDDDEETLATSAKKSRLEISDDDNRPEPSSPTVQVSSTTAEGEECNPAPSSADESHRDDVNRVKSGKKKRKKQKKSKEKLEQETLQLRVLSKAEWKRLKNRYLALQKANMSNLKRSLGCVMNPKPPLSTQSFGASSPSSMVPTEPTAPAKKFEFQPHVVVKLTLTSPIANPKALIEKIKSVTDIDYVEAKLGESTVFVRCHSPSNAEKFLQSEFIAKVQEANLLEGDEEVRYWEKIRKDREDNRQRTSKVKLLARANKAVEKSRHIYFAD